MAKHAKIDIEKLYDYCYDDFFKILNDLLTPKEKENTNFDESNPDIL